MTPDGLVAGIIVDHNVSLASSPRVGERNRVRAKVFVGEQICTIPCSCVLDS